jgi:hypothetical protein
MQPEVVACQRLCCQHVNAVNKCLTRSNALHIKRWYHFWGRIPARKQGTKSGDGLSVSKFAGPKSDPDYGPRSGPTFGSRSGTLTGRRPSCIVIPQQGFSSLLEQQASTVAPGLRYLCDVRHVFGDYSYQAAHHVHLDPLPWNACSRYQ